MTDRTVESRQLAAILTAMLVLSGTLIVGMAVAAPTIDTSTTDGTSTQSEVTDGYAVDPFNGSGDVGHVVQINGTAGTTYEMKLVKNSTGVTYYTNTSVGNISTANNGANAHFNGTFTESNLDRVPMAIDENVTMDVVFYNTSNTSDNATIQVTLNNTDERSVHRVDSGEIDSKAFLSETEEDPLNPLADPDTHLEVEEHDVTVNGSNTTVIYTLEDTNATDPFDNATEVVDTDGAMTFMVVTMEAGGDTHRLPVFLNEKNDDWSLSDDGSYAVYDSDADTFTFELGDEVDGESTVTIDATTDRYGLTDVITIWRTWGRTAAMDFVGQGLSSVNPLSIVPNIPTLSIGPSGLAG